ncbi:hypothetical protein A9Q81_05220 [Gammaproteobacteria bacterium 42_54_T18]|nr:hypothetical protein A9Q81_05220 [Gammaproteobacteria bacterium 42_54_T18]
MTVVKNNSKHVPVIIEGMRTPFLDSGGDYSQLMACDLGAFAIAGLIERTGINAESIGMVSMGTVLHEVETSNVARECMLKAGVPSNTPAYTVSMAGLSPNIALGGICDMISLGRIDVGVAGGTETFSDVPIRLSQTLRRAAMKLRQDSSFNNILRQMRTLRLRDMLPVPPSGTDFTTRKTMGACAENMVEKFDVSREDSDCFTLRSHQLAVEAWNNGLFDENIVPVKIPNTNTVVSRDDSMREDISLEKLQRLKPIYDKENGIITAGSSSRFTDGAGAVLVTNMQTAERQGLTPKALVIDHVSVGVTDLDSEMLLGPAMAIPPLLKRNGLSMNDIDVWEVHEAFSAQIIANQNCLASAQFSKKYHGLDNVLGKIPIDKLNTWGGSLALGNPFAATGVRLLTTAVNRLQKERKRYAIVSSCAGGGLGSAILLESCL